MRVDEYVILKEGRYGFSGYSGISGYSGFSGYSGAVGQGVPAGGTTGQVLRKKSNTSYDTEWG
jgi:hypothetical protein